ncbi:hypothetical protein [Bartonella sp. HY406]|uniref:hypothetical protein n=1 Tax=Bartonella sp. HY406 TaxID=2979331 RepID=UPI0021C760C0|nr:hypothetical protein [Bartonella sp. HY406]UXN04881.1 hypothetical protein N6B01_14330 [Bartonella sp. HY406]
MKKICITIGLFWLACLYLSTAFAQDSILIFEDDIVKWQAQDGAKIYRFNDITIKVTPSSSDDDFKVRFDISKPNAKALTFEDYGRIGNISLARFSEGADYNIVLSIFSGGAHCCSEVYVVDYSNGAKLINVGSFDGDIMLPKDIDGDGLMEFITYDSRFFMFSAYAGAMPPMQILTIDNGAVRNVTKDERFIPAHENYFKIQSIACNGMVKENTGACAGLLGTAALLGVFDSTLQMLDFDSPGQEPANSMAPYSVCNDAQCKQPKTFNDEKSAFIHAMSVWGYQPSQYSENKDLTAFVTRLKDKQFGENSDACMDGPASLKTITTNNRHIVYELSRYEAGCAFENGAIIGNSLMAKAVCMGEGEPAWLENHIYNYDGNILALSSFTSTRFEDIYVQNMKPCGN